MISEKDLRTKYAEIFPILDERQRRVVAAADAISLGRGGASKVARASGLSRTTVHSGITELRTKGVPVDRIRKPGGGRKNVLDQNPGILDTLEALVDPETRGDPMSPLLWTCKSTRHLADALEKQGYKASYPVIADLLRELGYSLQANAKTIEGKDHPDRDEQFRYINNQVKKFLKKKCPVISVDTKKKELVGKFKNAGREWRKKGNPLRVNTHDFPMKGVGKAVPYGVYDIGHDMGWVNVGCDSDTASFAIESIRRWWGSMGKRLYSKANCLLICADSGGSNGYRIRLWKVELQAFANAIAMPVTVCHFPPGTSKWNKIEHRLFSYISMNWRGQPLISHEVVVNLIGSTKTRSGLRVKARLDKKKYQTAIKISDAEMNNLNIKAHKFHGDWNYTAKPT
jgi:transposase